MAQVKSELRYTRSHEWVAVDGGIATVGITDYAQEQLLDIVYVELPAPGARIEQNQACAVVESSKVAADVMAPVSGEIIEVNDALNNAPELINSAPYGDGWIYRLRVDDLSQLDSLLDAEAYQAHCESEQR